MNQKLSNIQALRGIAAMLVLLSHLGGLGTVYPFLPKFDVQWGVFGVDVFFVISGFIMFYVTRSSWGLGTRFMLSRAARVYPLWWICLLIQAPWMFGYLSGKTDQYFAYAAKSFFLLPALSPHGELYPPLVVGWTLIYEVFFYFVFAVIMLTTRRNVSLKILAVFVSTTVIGFMLPDKSVGNIFLSNPIYLEFVFGIAIAELLMAGHLTQSLAYGAIGVVLLFTLAIAITPKLTATLFDSFESLRFVWFGIPAACVVLITLRLENKGYLAHPWLICLGDASYAIYLTHDLLLAKLPLAMKAHGLTENTTLTLWFIGFFAVGVGLVVHYLVERPIHRLMTSWLRFWKAPNPAIPPTH